VSFKEQFIKNVPLFFIKLSTQFLIPDSTVELIAQELLSLSVLNEQYVVKSISPLLCSLGFGNDSLLKVTKAMVESNLIKTSWNQEAFFKAQRDVVHMLIVICLM
jgi:hypothetical protein